MTSGPRLDDAREELEHKPTGPTPAEIAAHIAEANPAWWISYNSMGWTATRKSDGKTLHALTPVGLEAIIGVYFD